MRASLRHLFPGSVAVVHTTEDTSESGLRPAEAAYLADANGRRRAEFASVRACARAALAQLNIAPCDLVPSASGCVDWPAGTVGSMTHCDGFRAAAVARSRDLAAIGIDAEPHRPLPQGLLTRFATKAEFRMCADLRATHSGTDWDRLLFSAHEAAFKAHFNLFGSGHLFTGRTIRLNPHGTFDVVADNHFRGRWGLTDSQLITAVWAVRR